MLKQFRQKHDLTQAEFAKRIGVPRTTYQSWELGKRNPSPSNQLKINMMIRRYKAHKFACEYYEALTKCENKPHFLSKRKLLKLLVMIIIVLILAMLY